jgi:hypothetical protein
VGKQQSKEREQQAAGLKAPGEKKPRGENCVVIKMDGGVWNRPKGALEHYACRKQEYASGQY